METKIKVLIADAGEEFRCLLRDSLRAEGDIEVVGTAADGLEVISKLPACRPDVLLMDLVLPRLDGMGVLQRIGETGTEPVTMIVSAFYSERMISRCAELGASYFIPKPCDISALAARIRQCVRGGAEDAPRLSVPAEIRRREPDLETTVTEVIHEIGVPAHIKGYQYLREAVKMVMENPERINRITKELYPGIAHRFGTTSSKVERAIRHAIEVAWNRGRIEALDEAFGRNVCSLDDKPTNGEFIALVSDRLRIKESA